MEEVVSDCSMWNREDHNSYVWSREDDIAFERSLANNTDESEEKWEKIAADVPGKSVEQIKEHYEILVEDVSKIESGYVPLPTYGSPEGQGSNNVSDEGESSKKRVNSNARDSKQGGKSKSGQDRGTRIQWSEEEHRLFLLGLEKFGKGDWRSISRLCVRTRTPIQVASHAQKHFDRQNGKNKRKRRKSIHDITTVSNTDRRQKQPVPQPLPGPPMFGTSTIGQPVGESWISEVGTSTICQPVGESWVSEVGTSTICQPVGESWVSEVGTSTICQPVGESWVSEVGTSTICQPVGESWVSEVGTSTICQPVGESWISEVGTSTICQPVDESWVSEVGTSVNFPALPHVIPVPGSVVPGEPMNMDQMLYSMSSSPMAPR